MGGNESLSSCRRAKKKKEEEEEEEEEGEGFGHTAGMGSGGVVAQAAWSRTIVQYDLRTKVTGIQRNGQRQERTGIVYIYRFLHRTSHQPSPPRAPRTISERRAVSGFNLSVSGSIDQIFVFLSTLSFFPFLPLEVPEDRNSEKLLTFLFVEQTKLLFRSGICFPVRLGTMDTFIKALLYPSCWLN